MTHQSGMQKHIVRTACAPLLEVLENGTVQVIHHSFTEFLLENQRRSTEHDLHHQFPVLVSPSIHESMTKTCLKYLQSGCLRSSYAGGKLSQTCDAECDHGDWPCPKPAVERDLYDYKKSRLHHPFMEYAVTNGPGTLNTMTWKI